MIHKFTAPLLAGAIALTAPAFVSAEPDGPFARQIIARQSLMRLYAFNIGTLVGMAKGQVEYDADTASAAAANLASLAALNQQGMWPPGSDSFDNEGTRALPEIWDKYPDITKKGAALVAATASFAKTAGTGLDGLRAGLGGVGDACSACHKAYRKPK